jgi:hypothetical protein
LQIISEIATTSTSFHRPMPTGSPPGMPTSVAFSPILETLQQIDRTVQESRYGDRERRTFGKFADRIGREDQPTNEERIQKQYNEESSPQELFDEPNSHRSDPPVISEAQDTPQSSSSSWSFR